MFETKYHDTFSKVTASRELYRRVRNMKNVEQHHRRPVAKLILLAAAISMLVLGVAASETIGNWFRNYFAGFTEGELTAEQGTYLDINEQIVNQIQTVDGYTMKLKSALTDGTTAYLLVEFSAPEELPLKNANVNGDQVQLSYFLYDNLSISDSEGNITIIHSGESVRPNWENSNAQEVLFHFTLDSDEPIGPEMEWCLQIQGLTGKYYIWAYLQELQETKYANAVSYQLTKEEQEKGNPRVRLTDKGWNFTFRFDHVDFQETELIDDPIEMSAYVWKSNATEVWENVTITSFKLSPLSATMEFSCKEGLPMFEYDLEDQFFAVMKDGSSYILHGWGGDGNTYHLLADAPIILENVDYILLPDGTQIPNLQ